MNKIKGINEKQFNIIYDIIKDYKNFDFYIYGSRVNGNFSTNSDLDIIAKNSNEIPYDILEELKLKFDQSDLPFIVHISDFHKLDLCFLNLIENSMVKL